MRLKPLSSSFWWQMDVLRWCRCWRIKFVLVLATKVTRQGVVIGGGGGDVAT